MATHEDDAAEEDGAGNLQVKHVVGPELFAIHGGGWRQQSRRDDSTPGLPRMAACKRP